MSVDTAELDFTVESLKPVMGLNMLLEVDTGSSSAQDWANEHRDAIRSLIDRNGALLLRGLRLHSSTQFGQVLESIFGSKLLEYVYRSTPRTELRGNVYTATEYPASEVIPQHNENSYSRSWPNRIGFLCLLPSETGGETPIGDSRKIYNLIPAEIREKFERKGVMYVRNYSDLDLSWQVVFQTDRRDEVEDYCDKNGLSYQWLENNALRTVQVNPATAVHPVTGEKLWFNQAHLFHASSLSKEIFETLLASLGEDNLPRNSYYGDGSNIEPETLALIHDAYNSTKIKFMWQKGDLLLLDNMLYTHGRESYTGPRKVLTGMACPNERIN